MNLSRQGRAGEALPEVERVGELERAGALLSPLRLSILEQAREPASATAIASRLGESRQKVNYHVKELEKARFLRPTEQRRRGNLFEQLYVATARSYVLDPRMMAPLDADPERIAERQSAARLLSIAGRMQSEVARAHEQAQARGEALPTLSIEARIGFTSAGQRAAFARALRDAVTDVVGRFAGSVDGGEAGEREDAARPYRLVVGCHPIPPAEEDDVPETEHHEETSDA